MAPGAIDTGFMDEALTDVPDREATLESVAASHPLGRLARAEEIAEVIAFSGLAALQHHHRSHPDGRWRVHRAMTHWRESPHAHEEEVR